MDAESTCHAVDVIREATPIVLALIGGVVVPFVTWQIGKRTPRPEEHAAVAEKAIVEAANERLKVALAEVKRASPAPTAPTPTAPTPSVTVNVGEPPPPDPELLP